MTHEQYLDEPSSTIDWTLSLATLEAEVQASGRDSD